MCLIHYYSTYPELFLLYNKYKALIVVRIQVSHLHACLLLFPYSLPASVQELELYVGI